MKYIAQTVFTSNDIKHYGVRGMKWGTHKGNLYTRTVNSIANDLGTNSTLGRAANNYASRRYAAEKHNGDIKNAYGRAKVEYKNAKKSGSKEARKAAATKLKETRRARYKNVAGRALATSVGITKAHQGRYYQNREAGDSKGVAALKTYGNMAANVYLPTKVAKEYVLNKGENSTGRVNKKQFNKSAKY